MNFVYISPHFPKTNWEFCDRLKQNGVTVLGIADVEYNELDEKLKNALTEYYKVSSLENYDEVLKAVGYFTFKYGKIDWLESNNEYWLEQDAKLRTDFNITTGIKTDKIHNIKEKSAMKSSYEKGGISTAAYHMVSTLEEAEKLAKDEVYFGILILKKGLADGLVSGAIHSTKDTLKPTLQIIGVDKNKSNIVSSFFIMELPENRDNTKNILKYDEYIFSDAGLVENPTEDQLVDIAKASRNSYENIIGETSYTAMLSYSTMGSASSPLVEKVQNATRKLKEENIPNVDGELQLDAAIMEDIAKSKAKGSTVAGKANTLIFPDLNAGNIGYKLVQRFANANAYGPLCQGLNIPVNDLSRGSTVDDIYGVIYITAVQSN